MKKGLILLLCLLGPALVQAETRYITDQVKITMRKGESTGHRIIKMLPSGTAVEVLGTNAKTGYSQIRTEEGTEGYVLSRQLLERPVARDRLAEVEARLAELQQAPEQLGAQLSTLREQHGALESGYQKLKQENQSLAQELATVKHTSANAVRIGNERDDLRKSVAALTREVEDLKQRNRDLSNRQTQNWFLIGAGVIIVGIILGLILPHLRFQRRTSSWGSL